MLPDGVVNEARPPSGAGAGTPVVGGPVVGVRGADGVEPFGTTVVAGADVVDVVVLGRDGADVDVDVGASVEVVVVDVAEAAEPSSSSSPQPPARTTTATRRRGPRAR